MAEIVISEFMDDAAIHQELSAFDVHYDPQLVDDRERLIQLVEDAKALVVRNRTQVDADLLAAASDLKVVGRLGVGLDNIDLDACKARGVVVHPATGANDTAVAEYVIGAAMILLRGCWHAGAQMTSGEWPRNDLIGREISGKRLGLLGFGSIARQTALRAAALGMQVAAFDPYVAADDPAWADVARLSMEEIARSSDVVSLHVPLTDDTRSIVDAGFIASMRNDAILINAARGGVVDEGAVVDALTSATLGGAALDVFESEPLGAAAERFANVPNLMLTPHIAGVTIESNVRVSRVTAENVAKLLRNSTA